MLDVACEESKAGVVVGREGMAMCSHLCSPVVATKREPWDLLPGGRRGRWVGYRCSLRGKPRVTAGPAPFAY